MSLSEADRKNILRQHLDHITDLSDIEYQKRVWVKGEGPECEDFDEAVNFFYTFSNIILPHYQDYKINQQQHDVLVNFSHIFKAFAKNHYWPENFIYTDEWKKIMGMAKELLVAFNYKPGSADDFRK